MRGAVRVGHFSFRSRPGCTRVVVIEAERSSQRENEEQEVGGSKARCGARVLDARRGM